MSARGCGRRADRASEGVSRPSPSVSKFLNRRRVASTELTLRPLAEWAYPVTAPCAFAHRINGVVQVGQPLVFVPSEPGYVWSRRFSRQTWPSASLPKPLTSTSYL